MFDNKEEIEPYMEDEKGPTFEFCREIALKYKAFVAAGYPRIKKGEDQNLYYNSVCFVSPEGELITTYDKSFLYETDHNWAVEGSGFVTLTIPQWNNKKIGLGICMDINPYEFKDSSKFEFAKYHEQNKTELIIFCSNWLDSNVEDHYDTANIHNYWAHRLTPLMHRDCVFIACNRIGKEKGATFCGGSCVIGLKKPSLDAALSKRGEGVLVHEFDWYVI
eukprot:Phypoly_transcript_14196.p1 GENE.Phypoly_transcript_14196~~Phypoly_transcript_14196.p1  ORF type:complete len:220 (+),score=26.22 Phypoly_transcript_14196:268-927(+)